MRKLVLWLAALLVLRSRSQARTIRRRPHSGRQRKQPPPSGLGKDEHPVPAGRPDELRRRGRQAGRRPVDPVRQQPHLQRRRARTCSRRTASPSGASSGASSWTTRSGCARRPEARTRRSPFSAADPLESFTNTLGSIPFARTPAAPGTGSGRTARRADQHRLELHRRLQRLRRDRIAARVAARGLGRRTALQQRGEAAAAGRLPAPARRPRQRRSGAADGADGPAGGAGRVREGHGRRRRAGEREHRAHRHAHAVRPGAQPDRRRAAALAVRGGEVPDRPARGRRGAAVHHLQRVPAGARRPALAVPRLQGRRQREPRERVRSGRLPRAQHDPRRVRVDRRGGGLHRRAAGRDSRRRASRSWPRATRSSS